MSSLIFSWSSALVWSTSTYSYSMSFSFRYFLVILHHAHVLMAYTRTLCVLFFPSTLFFFILSRSVLYLVFSWFNITVLVLGPFSHGSVFSSWRSEKT